MKEFKNKHESLLTEEELSLLVAEYIAYAHPDALVHFDFGSGVRLPMHLALKNKKLNKRKGHPDLAIYEPRRNHKGLFIEIKTQRADPFRKNGKGLKKNEHCEEQEAYLHDLRRRGYKAEFGVGFEQIKAMIDAYLFQSGHNKRKSDKRTYEANIS